MVEYEPAAFSPAQLQELRQRGYSLKPTGRSYGNQQVLFWDKQASQVEAASDPRGLGEAQVFPVPH
ncbi:hypothetical protein D3C76_1204030 [compost metagenome]